MGHPLTVKGFASIDELARLIGKLDCDKGGDFLKYLEEDIKRQAKDDREREQPRPKLAGRLDRVAKKLYLARGVMYLTEKPGKTNIREHYKGSLDDLAQAVGEMYDKGRDFLGYLADDIKRQADDGKGKRDMLLATAERLYEVRDEMDSAWKICKHYDMTSNAD